MNTSIKKTFSFLLEFSIPLIAGVIGGIAWANIAPESFQSFKGQYSFLINEVFMAFFFALAAAEIVQACQPGGDLNPPKKALMPVLATLGGVVGPVILFFAGCYLLNHPDYLQGWGIVTATDIALAWLVARMIFGKDHPAITFLLLLAIIDDAIGMAIVAIFYPNPDLPVQPWWLGGVATAMLIAYLLRRKNIENFWYYLLIPGVLSWISMHEARLHPALSLVAVIPFMPTNSREDAHVFEYSEKGSSTLEKFEHSFSTLVTIGLFFFGLLNAGVRWSGWSELSLLLASSLVVGKALGVFLFCYMGILLGLPLPDGMQKRDTLIVGIIAGIGLTVALFVAELAFSDSLYQANAKIGALLSIIGAPLAILFGRMLRPKT